MLHSFGPGFGGFRPRWQNFPIYMYNFHKSVLIRLIAEG